MDAAVTMAEAFYAVGAVIVGLVWISAVLCRADKRVREAHDLEEQGL